MSHQPGQHQHVATSVGGLQHYSTSDTEVTALKPTYHPVTSAAGQNEVYSKNIRQTGLDEKDRSVLHTPAPRHKRPTPTNLDDSERSDVRGHLQHITPERNTGTKLGL